MSEEQKRKIWVGDTLYESVSAALRETGYASSSLYKAVKTGRLSDGTEVRFADGSEGDAKGRGAKRNPGGSKIALRMGRMAAEARKEAEAATARAIALMESAQAAREEAESLAEQAAILEETAARLGAGEEPKPAKKPSKPGPVPAPKPAAKKPAPQPKMVGNPAAAKREESEPEPSSLTRADIERAAILINGNEFEDVVIAADEMEMDVDELIQALLSGATTHGEHDDEIGLADSGLEAERREAVA